MRAYAGRQFVPFLWWSLVWPGREANSRPTVREADTLPTEPTRHRHTHTHTHTHTSFIQFCFLTKAWIKLDKNLFLMDFSYMWNYLFNSQIPWILPRSCLLHWHPASTQNTLTTGETTITEYEYDLAIFFKSKQIIWSSFLLIFQNIN